MSHKITLSFTIFLVLLGGILSSCTLPAGLPAAPPAGPRAWIDQPLDGSAFPPGPLEIVSHYTDSGGTAQVEISIDGVVLNTVPSEDSASSLITVRHTWRALTPGTYTISVRGQGTNGAWGNPASVRIIIMGPETATPLNSVTLVASDTPTSISVPTGEPTMTTVSNTFTPTPAGEPVITLIKNAFCRKGPSTSFSDVTAVPVGDQVNVRGVSEDGFWLFIYWPKFKVECWIVASAAPADFNPASLPVLRSPSTPSPRAPTAIPATPTSRKP